MNRRLAFAVICTCILSSFGVAQAQVTAADNAIASQLFEEAQALAETGNISVACTKFAESNRLDPQLGTLLYLGDCYAQEGKTASAWVSFRNAVDIATNRHDERERAAQAQLEALSAQLTRMTIHVNPRCPADVEVRIEDRVIGRAARDAAIPVDPGKVRITARATGFTEWVNDVEIPKGPATIVINVPELIRLSATEPIEKATLPKEKNTVTSLAEPASVARRAAHGEGRDALRQLLNPAKYVLFATGATGVGVGTIFALLLRGTLSDRDKANNCSARKGCSEEQISAIQQLTRKAEQEATVANIGFVVGGTALAAGLVTVALSGPSNGNPGTSRVSATAGPAHAGLRWETTW